MLKLKTTQASQFSMLSLTVLFVWFTLSLSFPESASAQSEKSSTAFKTPELPQVKLSTKSLDLSRTPSTEELMAAGQLGGALYPTEEVELEAESSLRSLAPGYKKQLERNRAINLDFGKAIQKWNKHEYKEAVKMFKKHVEEYPDSAWASEAVLHVGCDARYNGRYTESEESFEWIMEQNEGKENIGAKMLLNKARSRLAVQKVLQGNLDEALEHFATLKQESPDWRHRTYAAHWIQRLSQYNADETALLNCGTQALASVMRQNGDEQAAKEFSAMTPDSLRGYSILDLKYLAADYGYNAVGLQLTVEELQEVPLPAVMQIDPKHDGDSGHYWVLEEIKDDELQLFDSQSERRFHQTLEQFAREWEGNALVFTDFADEKILPGMAMLDDELGQLYGGCCGVQAPENDLGDPGDAGPGAGSGGGSGGDSNSSGRGSGGGGGNGENNPCGSPTWTVNMINMNLHVKDIPLWYNPPIGPSVSIMLSYNSQASTDYNQIFGNKWLFAYSTYLTVDTGGNVTVFMPDGRRDVYTPDGSSGYERPYHVYNTLTNTSGNRYELRFPDDTVYVYDLPNPGYLSNGQSIQPFLVEIRDAHGQKLTFSYNLSHQLTIITDALGRNTTLSYDNLRGLVKQVSDPFGRSASFEYDSKQNLVKITDMGGYWTSLSYDNDVYLSSLENSRGKWLFDIEAADGINNSSNAYPAPGETMWANYRITITNPEGGKEEYYYNGYSGYSWYVSPNDYQNYVDKNTNHLRSYTPKIKYDFTARNGQRGEIKKRTTQAGRFVGFAYDDNGNRTSISDEESTTAYTYNDMGMVTSITEPNGNVITLSYAANDVDVTEIGNGLGTVRMAYNDMHDVTSITDRLNNTTHFSYNGYGQMTSQTDALGVVTDYNYDAEHNLIQITRNGQVIASFTYDSIGRMYTQTDASDITLTYAYNNLNHITSVTYPDGRSTSYEYSGCCPRLVDRSTDQFGRSTSYTYDGLKRLISSVNNEGGLSRFVYDKNDNLLQFLDPNSNATSFEYDGDDRMVSKTYADGKGLSFAYDDKGRVKTRTDAHGITTTYSYNINDDLTGVAYSDDTPDVTYSYDTYGRITQRQDGIGTYQFSYDSNSRMTSVDGPWENDTISYQYDVLGRRTSMSVEGSEPVTYEYDRLNRLTAIHVGEQSYTYNYSDTSPMVQSLTRPNGSVTTYDYDLSNRLTAITNKTSSNEIVNKFAYTYNAQGIRDSETVTNGEAITSFQEGLKTYNYNALNQLLNVTNPDQTFSYDANGNMTTGYTPDGYQFTAAYDAENRLKSLEFTDSSGVIYKTIYRYSGDNFLAEIKTYTNASLVKTTHIIRKGFLAVQERDANNTVHRGYVWGPNMGGGIGGLLTLKQDGQNFFYLYDGKGNVTTLLNSSQNVVMAYRYSTFGSLMTKTGSIEQPFLFSTKRYDAASGLSYYGYRFYSSMTKRWMTKDPLGEQGGINLYGFIAGNPVNNVDIYGLKTNRDNRQNFPKMHDYIPDILPSVGMGIEAAQIPVVSNVVGPIGIVDSASRIINAPIDAIGSLLHDITECGEISDSTWEKIKNVPGEIESGVQGLINSLPGIGLVNEIRDYWNRFENWLSDW